MNLRNIARFLSTALIALLASNAFAQDWAKAKLEKSPRHGEWVTIKHDNRSVQTWVVYPEAKDKRGVVILIHEIFGLSDWAQELADAGHGVARQAREHLAQVAAPPARPRQAEERGRLAHRVDHRLPLQGGEARGGAAGAAPSRPGRGRGRRPASGTPSWLGGAYAGRARRPGAGWRRRRA